MTSPFYDHLSLKGESVIETSADKKQIETSSPATTATNDGSLHDLGGRLLSQRQNVQLAFVEVDATLARAHKHHAGTHSEAHPGHSPRHSAHAPGHAAADHGRHAAHGHAADHPVTKKPDSTLKHVEKVLVHTEETVKAAIAGFLGPIKQLPNAHGFGSAMNNYWHKVSYAKSHHQYETAYPPVYPGMDAPRATPASAVPAPDSIKSAGHLPSLENLLAAQKDLNRIVTHNKTAPDFNYLGLLEPDFKKRYAAESVNVGKEFNMNKDQMANLVKRVYAFEGGGWGTYYTLSSMPQEIMADNQTNARLKFHPSSTAIGYNQILMKETSNDIIQHGGAISARLNELANEDPKRADILHSKAHLVDELQDVLTHKPVPGVKPPGKHEAFYANSSRIEQAVHSLNLDGDVGPVIQSQELYALLKFSRDNKFNDSLSAKTTIETTHAAEFDKLPSDKKLHAVAELMGLIYPPILDPAHPELQTVFDNTKESLRLKFIELGLPRPPKSTDPNTAIERDHLSTSEFKMMNSQVLTIRRYGGEKGPLTPEGRALLDKITFDYFGGYNAEHLQAAAIELANLSGMGTAANMLKPDNNNLPTSNFFAKNGYESNPVTSRRSVDELLLQIYRIMHGPNADPSKPGMKQFNDAFASLPTQSVQRQQPQNGKPIT